MEKLDIINMPLEKRHLIEASAGTGKTHNITRLYLRLIVEAGLTVEQVLVMTFTKAATEELRGRLRELMKLAYDQWDTLDEPLFVALRDRVPAKIARARLQQALLSCDEAAVFTIHGFCKRALSQQAFASGISFSAEMDSSPEPLMLEALQDWYRQVGKTDEFDVLAGFWKSPEEFMTTWGPTIADMEVIDEPKLPDLGEYQQAIVDAWQAEKSVFDELNISKRRSAEKKLQWSAYSGAIDSFCQSDWDGSMPEFFCSEFIKDGFNGKKADALPLLKAAVDSLQALMATRRAHWAWQGILFARQHMSEAKVRLNQLDFSDLILQLRDRLTDEGGQALADQLLEQYPVALVDEFQDTDPAQYSILERIYQPRESKNPLLCMIGDPKQAIYGFRGGDVFAYLQARDDADFQWNMDTNFRSHPDVVNGYNRMFYGNDLDQPKADIFNFDIDYIPVAAGARNPVTVSDPSNMKAVNWILHPADDKNLKGYPEAAKDDIAKWCAQEAARLLTETDLNGQATKPNDIAILVGNRFDAERIQSALTKHGLRSVFLSASENVLTSPEAASLSRLLKGILELERDRSLIAAVSTPWYGLSLEQLHVLQDNEAQWAKVQAHMSELRDIWENQGIMSMGLALFKDHVTPNNHRHERFMTNALHLLELLQAGSQKHPQPWGLLEWFDECCEEATKDPKAELRLESDANLIQIVTQHSAKGLEYPIVFLPFISHGRRPKVEAMVRYHDRTDYSAHKDLDPSEEKRGWHAEEMDAEKVRLLYVAATRPISRLYMVACHFQTLPYSQLGLCFQSSNFGDICESIEAQAGQTGAHVETIDLAKVAASAVTTPQAPELEAAVFTGSIERDWHLASFSSLTRRLRHGGLSKPDRDQQDIEDHIQPSQVLPLRFTLQKGAMAGNLLHDCLEELDFQSGSIERDIQYPIRKYGHLLEPSITRVPQLTEWLGEILNTQLGDGPRLADLQKQATLRESEFYFPLDGTGSVMKELAAILAKHRGVSDVYLPEASQLKGMMHGFIDLVYRWQGRYFVVDYKSTHLGNSLSRYDDPAMSESIQSNFYDVQYLIYTVALHRYLKARIPDYDPAQHLGGIQYLYVRGMKPGNATGVYSRGVDLEALEAMDALFTHKEQVTA